MSSFPSLIHTLLFAIIIAYASADFTGDWLLKKAVRNGVSVKVPQGDVSLSITKSKDSYNVYIKAANTIKGRMIVKGKNSKTKAVVDFEEISSTRMMPTPKFLDVERFLMKAIPKMKMVILKDSGNLIWKGANATAIFSPSKKKS